MISIDSSPLVAGAALAVAAAGLSCDRALPSRPVRETVREILADPSAWTVSSSLPDSPPHVGVLTPALSWVVDGGDLPALVMPPPCEVRFEIRPEDGPVRLRASAGGDRKLRWQLASAPADCEVVFEIDVDGETKFSARLPAHAEAPERAWRHIGGSEGLPLEPGDVVTLRTALTHPVEVVGELAPLVGFGRLVLERWVERPRERASPEEPNVVLILMDTLRADSLSCYGHPPGTTPNLDTLAARGLLFDRAYATSSWTWPSTASILTGLPPDAHGVVDDGACYLDARLDTLAEALLRANLVTGAFACNPLLDPVKNFEQGFESYVYYRDFQKTDVVLPAIEAWLETHAPARFFLYLHLVDPHEPVTPRPEDAARLAGSPPEGFPESPAARYRPGLLRGDGLTEHGALEADRVVPREHQAWFVKRYAAGVATADHYVGEVLRMLEARGLADETIVAFTSDHGEELFDHGLLGHGITLYQELVRVPLILAGPGIPSGIRVATPVSNMDLAWTLARRAGSDLPGAWQQVDLASPDSLRPGPIYFSTRHGWWWNAHRTPILGVLEWPWVLHAAPKGLPWGAPPGTDPGEGQVRLFDLERDPAEQVDRAAERSDLANALRVRALEHAAAAAKRRTGSAIGAGDATSEMLQRIGYTGDER